VAVRYSERLKITSTPRAPITGVSRLDIWSQVLTVASATALASETSTVRRIKVLRIDSRCDSLFVVIVVAVFSIKSIVHYKEKAAMEPKVLNLLIAGERSIIGVDR